MLDLATSPETTEDIILMLLRLMCLMNTYSPTIPSSLCRRANFNYLENLLNCKLTL